MSFYEHQLERRQIRLVTILPSNDSSSLIECTIRIVQIDDLLNYEALSYVWGTTDDSVRILIETEPFIVTKNLGSALRQLRDTKEARTMWIDAICINQDDNAPEKPQQLLLMRPIYERASKVVIYVGDQEIDSDLALDTISRINDELQQQLDNKRRDLATFWSSLNLGETTFFRTQPFDPRPWVAINRLFQRPWWTRVWTVQEVILPQNSIDFLCGRKSVSWLALQRVSLMLAKYDFESHWQVLSEKGYSLYHAAFEQPIHARKEIRKASTRDSTLLSYLVGFYQRQCTSPLDKIYGFLGVASDFQEKDIPINYQLPVQELFGSVAVFFVNRYEGAKFLALCQRKGRMTDLPSWTPDWTIQQPDVERLKKETAFESLFKILGSASRPQLLLRIGLDLLHSRVQAVGEDPFETPMGAIWHWLSLVNAHTPNPYPTGQSNFEALWRTLVMNRTSDMRLAERGMFEHLLIPYAVEKIKQGIDNPSRQFALGASLMAPFVDIVWLALSGRRFFVADNGYIGLAPKDIEVSDCICLIFGVEVPIVLRAQENGCMEIIGECYCHGIMEGEGLKDYWDSKAAPEALILN
ncbi:uncharacterized protein KY384_009109 [Bacidia gigantensis]|uniref:uncharacterized protein n=1 Tax=Bacidia gigantensis TaxID=2732470 RepID=UPI001D054D5A|nr:uncharacterized protein KY384_009109 [Bacidia gigantensis]KAG8525465.1 hypothetical protein KY384_009109 [Bacidia gigantensis]